MGVGAGNTACASEAISRAQITARRDGFMQSPFIAIQQKTNANIAGSSMMVLTAQVAILYRMAVKVSVSCSRSMDEVSFQRTYTES